MRTRTKRLGRALPKSSFRLAKWLLQTLNGSKIGFAIYDKSFHYVGVNFAIAAMNGVPPEEHLGQTPRDVVGRTSIIIEPRIDRVFLTGEPVYHHEFSAKLPKRTDVGYWIQDYFPISDDRDRISHVGIFVVEVTEQQRLLGLIQAAQPRGARVWSKLPPGALFDSPPSMEFPTDVLSARELEVLSFLAQGKSNKEVGSALTISEKTVETYRSRIKLKLGLKSLVELVHYAIQRGIVKP